MPPTSLAPRTPNPTAKKELSPYLRGQIHGAFVAGASPKEISDNLYVPISTVRDTITKSPFRSDGKSAPRSGRPKIATEQEKRLVVRAARKYPKLTYDGLRKEAGVKLSTRVLRDILKEAGLRTGVLKGDLDVPST
jgi:transposase